MSRVDSARIAALQGGGRGQGRRLAAPLTKGSVVASDAFFPFADGLLAAIEAGATAVIQPGGSMRDDEVIAAADDAAWRWCSPAWAFRHDHHPFAPAKVGPGARSTDSIGRAGVPLARERTVERSSVIVTAPPNPPSRLAATDSFDSVSPEPAISWIGRADAFDLGLPRLDPVLPPRRRRPTAVADHGGGQSPLGVAIVIQRAVEREPIEVIRHRDAGGRVRHPVELEEVLRREVGAATRRPVRRRVRDQQSISAPPLARRDCACAAPDGSGTPASISPAARAARVVAADFDSAPPSAVSTARCRRDSA